MASFFAKLHGTASPSVLTATKNRQAPQTKTTTEKFSVTSIIKPKLAPVDPTPKRPSTQISNSVRPPIPRRVDNGLSRSIAASSAIRRTQSSSPTMSGPPVTKKRKTASSNLKGSIREVTQLKALSPPAGKRRRTASPAYRVHRTSSDDETDFSEPVRLFRGETPDVLHHPVERGMVNARAGEDVEFMHASHLVCVVDKESFVAEDPEHPALDIVVQLPFGEERYDFCDGVDVDSNYFDRRSMTSIIRPEISSTRYLTSSLTFFPRMPSPTTPQ
jgi:hypothetical protein